MLKMENRMIVGYTRVRIDGQSLEDRQATLLAAGAVKRESQWGKDQLQRAIDTLSQGDVLLVTRFDRLARSTTYRD
jgi:DNA invertase Pin-like site-specific DNA recombinase